MYQTGTLNLIPKRIPPSAFFALRAHRALRAVMRAREVLKHKVKDDAHDIAALLGPKSWLFTFARERHTPFKTAQHILVFFGRRHPQARKTILALLLELRARRYRV